MREPKDGGKRFQQFLEEKVWQYMIDHAIVLEDGRIKIGFDVKSREDFEKKLASRFWSDYTFQSAIEIEKEAKRKQKIWKPKKLTKLQLYHYGLLNKLHKIIKNQRKRYNPELNYTHPARESRLNQS